MAEFVNEKFVDGRRMSKLENERIIVFRLKWFAHTENLSLMPLGLILFLQLKRIKKPRLPGICCKSTFYPVGAIQDVFKQVRHECFCNTSPDCLMPVIYDRYKKG